MHIEVGWVIAAAAAFLLAGTALLAFFSVLPGASRHARPLWPTLVTELVIAGAAGIAFWIGGAILTATLLVMAARVGYEAATVSLGRLQRVSSLIRIAASAAPLLLAALALGLPLPTAAAMTLLGAIVLAVLLLLRRRERMTTTNAVAEILLFPALPMAILIAASRSADYAGLLLAILLLVETYDSYALLGGKLLGRTPAFPRLSPRKTVEGLVVGAGALALTAALIGLLLFNFPVWACIAVALVVGALSTAGDLAASRLKRIAGVKDYPLIMPRQGGLFDIVDAWLMAGGVIVAAFILFSGS